MAYFFDMVIRTFRRLREVKTGNGVQPPLAFAAHGRCVREGFDHPDKLALHQALGAVVPRVAVHRRFQEIENMLDGGSEYEKLADAIRRVQKVERRLRKT